MNSREVDMNSLTCQMLRAPFQDVCSVQTSTHPHCSGVFCLLQLHIQQGEELGCCWNISAVCLQDYPRCGGNHRSPYFIVAIWNTTIKVFLWCLYFCHNFRVHQRLTSLQVHPHFALHLLLLKNDINLMWEWICCLTSHFPLLDSKSRKEKLEQVASFSLFGNVMSMASVQLVGANRDALLLSFKDAKVSLFKRCTVQQHF